MIGGIIMRQLKPFMVEFSGTPEAGKSTAIALLVKMLEDKGYRTMILKESAEDLPNEFEKGTFEGNLWIHLITQAGILKAEHADVDIVLIDRGIVDSKFYAWKYFKEKKCSAEQFNEFQRTCLNRMTPDLFLGIFVSPETAIKRRGGEGRLVTRKYLEDYNRLFMEFWVTIPTKKKTIKSDELAALELSNIIFDNILSEIS